MRMYIQRSRGSHASRKVGEQFGGPASAAVVEALTLKEGDDIEIHVAGIRTFEIARRPQARELLARLRKYRGRLPADFKFDRIDANERG